MTVPAPRKRWISLGLLFGGLAASYETAPAVPTPRRTPTPPAPAPLTSQARIAEETMRAVGYEPKVPYPGARSIPWARHLYHVRRTPPAHAPRRGAMHQVPAHQA